MADLKAKIRRQTPIAATGNYETWGTTQRDLVTALELCFGSLLRKSFANRLLPEELSSVPTSDGHLQPAQPCDAPDAKVQSILTSSRLSALAGLSNASPNVEQHWDMSVVLAILPAPSPDMGPSSQHVAKESNVDQAR